MGYGYDQDDGPIMCFNGAKSWQSRWYESKTRVIAPDPGLVYTSNLYGISNYGISASQYVLFKISTPRRSTFTSPTIARMGSIRAAWRGGITL
jgi:hypothetical protein